MDGVEATSTVTVYIWLVKPGVCGGGGTDQHPTVTAQVHFFLHLHSMQTFVCGLGGVWGSVRTAAPPEGPAALTLMQPVAHMSCHPAECKAGTEGTASQPPACGPPFKFLPCGVGQQRRHLPPPASTTTLLQALAYRHNTPFHPSCSKLFHNPFPFPSSLASLGGRIWWPAPNRASQVVADAWLSVFLLSASNPQKNPREKKECPRARGTALVRQTCQRMSGLRFASVRRLSRRSALARSAPDKDQEEGKGVEGGPDCANQAVR